MSSPSDTLTDAGIGPQAAAPTRLSRTRPFFWSVRREIWEHRELYVAPLIAAGVVLLGVVLSLGHPARTLQVTTEGGVVHRTWIELPAATPHLAAAAVIFLTTFAVAFFYCLGALNNERRDRSILFWKSLPVSDLTAVLSKAVVPLVVLPVIAFLVMFATQLVILALSALHPMPYRAGPPWDQLTAPWLWRMELYLLPTAALWYAPIWGWLLMVSAWSRRGAFLWALGPPLAICVVEKLSLGTSYSWSLIAQRLNGAAAAALTLPPRGQGAFALPRPDPVGFVTSLDVWGGLVFAALCLAAAVWLRRRREPI